MTYEWSDQDRNPRIDRIIRWANGDKPDEQLRGTPTPGARLDNLLGAPPVPRGGRAGRQRVHPGAITDHA